MKKLKILLLFSTGLDSLLAERLLQEQKQCEIQAVFFDLPFLAKRDDNLKNIKKIAKKLAKKHLLLHIMNCKKGKLFREYLQIIKKPKFGYGNALNPCIDCRIFMLKKAKQLAKKISADIIATGEVLNERPMSQRKQAMFLIEKEAGLERKLLRPLSAKLLPETEAEKKGLIDRNKLLAISGRSRKPQMQLAKKYKIEKYPTPAGGCLLCEKEFCKKLADLLKYEKKISMNDINLLKIGRHFRIGKCKLVVGKNEQENKILERQKGIKISAGKKSPTTLIIGKKKDITNEVKNLAAALTVRYSDYKKAKIFGKIVKPVNKKQLEKLRI